MASRTSFIQTHLNPAWRAEDTERCILANARVLWDRHAEDNRQALEEHAEYVRSMATLSAFMAGFVNIAFVQFDFTASYIPYNILMGFGVTNALTTAVNTCCMAICTFMLGSTFRTFNNLLSEEEEAVFMMRCRAFAKNYKPGSKPPTPPRNFRTHWEFFCRREWQRVLCLFTAGLIFFIANTAFAAFIKFNSYWTAAFALAIGLGPGLLFCLHLHLRWMPYLMNNAVVKPEVIDRQAQSMGMPFDWHLPGVRLSAHGGEPIATPQTPFAATSPLKQLGTMTQWRADLVRQRTLDDCHHLWQRYVRKTRSEVEERVEQLRSFSFLSGVVAGFAVAALLQLQVDVNQTPQSFQMWFSISAGLCAGCSTAAMAMCSLMLISIVKMSRTLVSEEEETMYLAKCLQFLSSYVLGSRPPTPARTFANHWDTRCESEWNRAFFLFALGLATFLANILAGIWIKYEPFRSVSIASTACLGIAPVYLFHLSFRWLPYLTGYTKPMRNQAISMPQKETSPMGLPFDWHLPPRPPPSKPPQPSAFSLIAPTLARLSQRLHISTPLGSLRRQSASFDRSSLVAEP